MINGSLSNYTLDLNLFVARMKVKIMQREKKHSSKGVFTTQEIKEHMVCEILEFFLIEDPEKRRMVRDALFNANIDVNESIDVANMAWAYDLSVRRDL